MNELTYFKTVDELNKHIGEIITLYYYVDFNKEEDESVFEPDSNKRQLSFKWMLKLESATNDYSNSIRHASIKGTYLVQLYSYYAGVKKDKPILMYHGIVKTYESTAQAYARLATAEEKKIFLKLNIPNKYKFNK